MILTQQPGADYGRVPLYGIDQFAFSGTGLSSFAELEGAIDAKDKKALIDLGDDRGILVAGRHLSLDGKDTIF